MDGRVVMAKYGVGQSVYLVYKKGSEYCVHSDMLMVQRVSVDNEGYHYSLVDSQEDIIDWCYEEDIFGSEENAVEECIDRNLIGG